MTRPIAPSEEYPKQNDNVKHDVNKNVQRDTDRGWAWVVLLSAFIGAVIGSGQFFNTGIYFYIFLNEFQASRSATMWITASQGASSALAGIIGSELIVKLGARKTMMLGAIIFGISYAMLFFANSVPYAIVCFSAAGVGTALLLLSNIAAVGLYFKERLNMAMGIVLSGAGLGTMVIGLEIEWAVSVFGWRGAMLIQSGIIFQICVCASAVYDIKPSSQKSLSNDDDEYPKKVETIGDKEAIYTISAGTEIASKQGPTKNSQESSREFLSDVRFWIQILGFAFFFASLVVTFQILKDYVISNGFSFPYSIVMICNGMANCIGRISGGYLASHIAPTLLNGVVTVVCGCAISMLLVTSVETVALLGITLFGLFNGLQGAPQTISWASLFGKDLMAVMMGYTLAAGCLPTLAMSPLAGYIVDQTNSFLPVVMLSSSFMITSGLLFLVNHMIHARKMGDYSFDHNLDTTTVSASIRLGL